MALQIEEHYDSGDGTLINSPTDTKIYKVWGTVADSADDPTVTDPFAEANIPNAYNSNQLMDIKRKRIAPLTWLYTANYVAPGVVAFRPTGEKAFTFTTAGGSQHITHALSHVETYAVGGTVSTDQDGALNVSSGGVDGADIDVKAFDFQITRYVSAADMSGAYVALLYALTDTTNASAFAATVNGIVFTFNEGECRFKNAQGSQRGMGDWEINLNFAGLPNVTGRAIGTITGIAKKGWEYLSVMYEQSEDTTNKFVAQKAKFVFIDQLYPEENWTGLVP